MQENLISKSHKNWQKKYKLNKNHKLKKALALKQKTTSEAGGYIFYFTTFNQYSQLL